LASRVHVLNDTAADPLAAFRQTNVEGTLELARQALDSKVKRFIFISSIGVNGAETFGKPFNQLDVSSPHSPYAVTKHEAEGGLRSIFKGTGVSLVIIRAPAIYGIDAPGNLGLVQKFIEKGLPLPLGSIKNKRSLLAIDNLVDLICECLSNPAALNKTFLASDGYDLSTPEIIIVMGALINKSPKLLMIPPVVLKILFNMLNKRQTGQSLLRDLQVDSSDLFETLNWVPPFNPKSVVKNLTEN
jgi:nucleoside-diphosphate-sugar epimerase